MLASAVALPLTATSPARASAPDHSCNTVYQARIFFWAMTCAQPGQPVIGAFGTWRNVPITFEPGSEAGAAEVSNYVRMVPNTDQTEGANGGDIFGPSIDVGLHAEKTGATTIGYGPRWTELGKRGGVTKAITAGLNPTVADNVNHTYMTVRQASGDQWDVLYDFNMVGTTTDQLKIPRGNPNRVDIGLEVRGPQHVTVPPIANRMQFMAENKAWARAATADTTQLTTLGICGKSMGIPSDPAAVYKAPYCFEAKLTDSTTSIQWTVSKPGPTVGPAPTTPARAAGTFNGVDQKALSNCLATDPESCMNTVPGLSNCVQTVKVCNAAALQSPQRDAARKPGRHGEPADIAERAAKSFGVARDGIRVASGIRLPNAKDSSSTAPQSSAIAGTSVVTVESAAPTRGLEHRGLTFQGFRATYSTETGQLLEACWGQMCQS
ncbi:hypothetical protein [Streptomyces spororaveus]|uniref:hypothetical protein n=1 Tax=Streptomyces spororaveus TaxID=284039 RepID=UPI001F327FBA|nr:hypothetical protein [Streptomyces spororaveus]